MRLRAIVFAILAFAAVGAGAWKLAEVATARYEAATAEQVRGALQVAGQGWASVRTDGLEVTLLGAAPDETSRFRALEVVRQVVDERRIEDVTTLVAAKPLPPPPFALELLRNEDDVSLIGLVPQSGGRDVIRAALRAGGLADNVTDMLESASDPAPEGWTQALGFGLSVLSEVPRAKISVAPGTVRVVAVADSDEARQGLEARLERGRPEGVTLVHEISAPRAVIAPYVLDFSLADGVGRLDACSAESEEVATAILTAAAAAGLPAGTDCRVGLGAPSTSWALAATRGIEAVKALGGGRFALGDTAAELTAPEGTAPGKLAEVTARLEAGLPDEFKLTAAAPKVEEPVAEAGPAPEFEATLATGGQVRLAGSVADTTSQNAILNYAAALFGHDRVMDTTEIRTGLPGGWPARVLAGVEALSLLHVGEVVVTPETVAVKGWGLYPEVHDKVASLLAEKVGEGVSVEATFNAAAAAAVAQAARPKPELCADQIGAILEAGSIQFAAGSADIIPESRGVIAAIADVLRGCPGADFEIAGHTDSQGSAAANVRLSDRRAGAVLAALRSEDLPAVGLTAHGYGADAPIADNTSETGRAANRRIEFRLVTPEEAEAEAEAEAVEDDEDGAEDPADALASCADGIGAVLAERPLQFDGGSAALAAGSDEIIGEIAEVLSGCPGAAFEIGGYTDSQGSDSGNLTLSQQRAEAVLTALRAKDLPLVGSVARGYGEAEPVADNATSEGRAQNRRIAFVPAAAAVAEPAPAEEEDAAPAASGEGAETACLAAVGAILDEHAIQFAAGSAELAAESAGVLDEIAAALKACPDVALEIGGHTDSEGSEQGNERLSQRRAEAVLAALRARELALPDAVARGYGESQPVADNATAEGRAQNRRIVFAPAAGEGSGDGSQ